MSEPEMKVEISSEHLVIVDTTDVALIQGFDFTSGGITNGVWIRSIGRLNHTSQRVQIEMMLPTDVAEGALLQMIQALRALEQQDPNYTLGGGS